MAKKDSIVFGAVRETVSKFLETGQLPFGRSLNLQAKLDVWKATRGVDSDTCKAAGAFADELLSDTRDLKILNADGEEVPPGTIMAGLNSRG